MTEDIVTRLRLMESERLKKGWGPSVWGGGGR